MRGRNYIFGCGLTGLFLLILGSGLAWFGTRNLIKMWAWERLTLKNGSEAMQRWMRPPQPVVMKVYIFNVTNPDDVSEGALPILQEVGPYVYEQSREKVNIIQLENFTLSYQLKNIIKFKKSRSGGLKESDSVTVINVPLAGSILSVYESVPEFVGMLDDIWQSFYPGQRNIFITTTVKDILFDGITIDCTSKLTEIYLACRGLESRKSAHVRKEGKIFKFSFLYAKNGTSPDTYQVHQGILDLKKSAQYQGVNYSPSVNVWKNYYCDQINGSDGAQFPVQLDKTKRLYLFEKELCRSVYAEFEKELNQNGVNVYKFSNTESLFASSEENPDNRCFCRSPMSIRQLVESDEDDIAVLQDEKNICFESGILPLMPCVGAPLVASFPHFYLGDQSYINYSGLSPNKNLHETYVYVEPISGMTVEGVKRVQLNIELKRIQDVQITSRLFDAVFPILWVEESTALTSEHFKLLRYCLIEKKVLETSTFLLIGIGLFLIITTYTVPLITKGKRKTRTPKTPDSDIYSRTARVRLNIWQKPIIIPTDSLTLNKSKINQLHNTFLTDSFSEYKAEKAVETPRIFINWCHVEGNRK